MSAPRIKPEQDNYPIAEDLIRQALEVYRDAGMTMERAGVRLIGLGFSMLVSNDRTVQEARDYIEGHALPMLASLFEQARAERPAPEPDPTPMWLQSSPKSRQ